jgi:predicted nucleotidyltransferase
MFNVSIMGKPSKEHKILELFFNEPSRQWHFKDVVRVAKISENRANFWLKNLLKEKIIIYHKKSNQMPYYTANFDYTNYKTKKKLYALERFYETGFLKHLESLNAKTIVIFGSFSRADWHSKSDIDLFIIGNDNNLEKGKYEAILHREIQLFSFKNQKEIKHINSNLIPNVINGYFVKGEVQSILGDLNA